jgi:hypothetical protein
VENQPYVGLWLDAVDRGLGTRLWNRFAFSGCVQGGKTLSGWVVPALYHLFEVGEDVLLGLPDLKMANDKWERDLKPVIELTRYRDLIPRRGRGSRGGTFDRLQFLNGATLKFMGAGGGDAQRSGYTGRVVIATEVDKFDEIGASSEETSKLLQMLARSEAHAGNEVIYLECTRSTTRGRIWRAYEEGTGSVIVCQCRKCRGWVTPGREDLKGWQDRPDELSAEEHAGFCCPKCGRRWGWEERRRMNLKARLLHRGQRIDRRGKITGRLPRTRTLGFCFNAFNNLFWPDTVLGRKEWLTAREENREEAEREALQFRWAVAVEPPRLEIISLDETRLQRRVDDYPRGIVPVDCDVIGVGTDIGRNVGYYIVVGSRLRAQMDESGRVRQSGGAPVMYRSYHVIDFSYYEMYTKDESLGLEKGILLGLREFNDRVGAGFGRDDGGRVGFGLGLVDSGWETDVVYQFCRESGGRWYPSKGYGLSAREKSRYVSPRVVSDTAPFVGAGYHVSVNAAKETFLFRYDADHWKRRIHAGLEAEQGTAGSIALFSASPLEHSRLVKHLMSEREEEVWTPEHGTVRRWRKVYKENHGLDCLVEALVSVEYQLAAAALAAGMTEGGDYFETQRRRN